MNAAEEEIDNALNPFSLTACAANKDYIIDRLSSKFKDHSNVSNRKLTNLWNGENKPSVDDSGIHKYDPSKYVFNNNRR